MKRLLVVDDEPTILGAVATRLRAEDFVVDTDVGPALRRLPESVRVCARYRDDAPNAWFEFNLSRSRASTDGPAEWDACAPY